MSVKKDSYVWVGVALISAAIGAVIIMVIIDMMQPKITLRIGDGIFTAKLAKTDIQRTKGLSDINRLSEDQAMLFVFAQEGFYGIWMKDMKIPIDIVWLDKDKKVIHVARHIAPDTYPTIYRPKDSAKYVLEFAAGTIDKQTIKIGSIAQFDERRAEEGVE